MGDVKPRVVEAPREIHLANELEASWYLRHIKRMIQIVEDNRI